MVMSADAYESKARVDWATKNPARQQAGWTVPEWLRANDNYWRNTPTTNLNFPDTNKTTTSGGYGSLYGQQRASAQQLINFYKGMLNGGWTGAAYQRVLDTAAQSRNRQIGRTRQYVQNQRGKLQNQTKRARGRINNQTAALEQYLAKNYQNPYKGRVAGRVGNVDTSAAMLADQGAGSGGSAMSDAQAQAAAYNQQADQALNDYNRAMAADSRDQQMAMLSAARMSRNSLLNDLSTNRAAIGTNLSNVLFGARQNAWNAYDQVNAQTQAQIAQQEQAYRDAMLQLALQYGLGVG